MSHPIKETHKKNNFSKWFKIFFIFLTISVFLIGLIFYLNNTTTKKANNPPSPTFISSPTSIKTETHHKILQEKYPDAPAADNNVIHFITDKDIIKTEKNVLQIKNSIMKLSNDDISVDNPTDIILAATGKVSDTTYSIYFFKNIVQNRVFDNLDNFNDKNISRCKISGTANTSFAENQKQTMLIVVNSDSSGWVVLPDNNDIATVDKIAGFTQC